MLFQLLLIALILLVTVLALRSLPGEKSLALKRLLSLAIAVGGVVAILFPQLLTKVASFFGIGRGTDLLLYGFIIAGLVFAVLTIRAKARGDARVTNLARAVALMEARLENRREAEDDNN